jgi:hypothetical protein
MISKKEIAELIKISLERLPEFNKYKDGDIHKSLSSLFVAELGNLLKIKYADKCYDCKFQNITNGKRVKGEWMLDIALVHLKELNINRQIQYINKIEVAVESEFNPGIRYFIDDFCKLLIIDSPLKIFINGVKRINNKDSYVESRMQIIHQILKDQQDLYSNYFICFVDHPMHWRNTNIPYVCIKQISNTIASQKINDFV